MAVNATPGAVNLAKEIGVDLSQVQGTGKNGLIVKRDVTSPLKKEEPKIEPEISQESKPAPKEEAPKIAGEEMPDKVEEIKVKAPTPVKQPKGVPPGEYHFDAEKTVSDDNLNHLVRFKGKTRWMTRQGLIVTMRDPRVKAVTGNELSEAEMLRQDIFYLEFPKNTQFTEKKR